MGTRKDPRSVASHRFAYRYALSTRCGSLIRSDPNTIHRSPTRASRAHRTLRSHRWREAGSGRPFHKCSGSTTKRRLRAIVSEPAVGFGRVSGRDASAIADASDRGRKCSGSTTKRRSRTWSNRGISVLPVDLLAMSLALRMLVRSLRALRFRYLRSDPNRQHRSPTRATRRTSTLHAPTSESDARSCRIWTGKRAVCGRDSGRIRPRPQRLRVHNKAALARRFGSGPCRI